MWQSFYWNCNLFYFWFVSVPYAVNCKPTERIPRFLGENLKIKLHISINTIENKKERNSEPAIPKHGSAKKSNNKQSDKSVHVYFFCPAIAPICLIHKLLLPLTEQA
jgi:hypothetical protein